MKVTCCPISQERLDRQAACDVVPHRTLTTTPILLSPNLRWLCPSFAEWIALARILPISGSYWRLTNKYKITIAQTRTDHSPRDAVLEEGVRYLVSPRGWLSPVYLRVRSGAFRRWVLQQRLFDGFVVMIRLMRPENQA